MKVKQFLIPIFTLALCLFVISRWTLGFKAFTVFSYALEKANPKAEPFPEISLRSQDNQVFSINEKRKFKLVNFVYLNCPSVCHKVNNQLEEIYKMADKILIPNDLEFVTISFDPIHDNVAKIKKYRSYFGDVPGWTFALPNVSSKEFDAFLKKLGVWIYKDPMTGIINHSVSLYLISPDNKIVSIFDPGAATNKTILKELYQCVERKNK